MLTCLSLQGISNYEQLRLKNLQDNADFFAKQPENVPFIDSDLLYRGALKSAFDCIYIYIYLNLLVITFSTTLTPLTRVVSRNHASPSDGDNKRLVCVRF
jgi:hypothetical protein